MNTPQKHKNIIIAWANGETIQYKGGGGIWCDACENGFSEFLQYRVKPENAPSEKELRQEKIEALKAQIKQLENEA